MQIIKGNARKYREEQAAAALTGDLSPAATAAIRRLSRTKSAVGQQLRAHLNQDKRKPGKRVTK